MLTTGLLFIHKELLSFLQIPSAVLTSCFVESPSKVANKANKNITLTDKAKTIKTG
jgi:hypothetical protein